jgi:prepilin-type N-terminal cleavage/methylation domain-containing protein/prepilin-type processing-associated H-X9-DG protein
MNHRGPHSRSIANGFTLIELLVVVGIIALLLAILLPVLTRARQEARSTACRANLHSLMTGVIAYSTANRDLVLPSYNMTGVTGNITRPLDGWGPILDREQYVSGTDGFVNNPFVCPNTLNIAGVANTQTGGEIENPQGYMDWPAVITISQAFSITIPDRGFNKIIRVGYWINADNLIGAPRPIMQGVHFTGSVGYGPDADNNIMQFNRTIDFNRADRVIALADGLYAGRQEVTRLGDRDSRIGYRHPGGVGRANLGFADGHAGAIEGDRFPRRLTGSMPLDVVREENLGNKPTVYSDPEKFLGVP